MATEKESSRTLFSSMAEDYERIGVPALFMPQALHLLQAAALVPGERVLDVACGTGIVARLAAPRLGVAGQIVGLDLNEAMLAVARAQAVPAGASIEWRQGDAMALPFPDAEVDAVLCQNGLPFMPDRVRALREMARVLKPGRRLVLSVTGREYASYAIEGTVERFLGKDVGAIFREPFSLGDAEALAQLFDEIDFRTVDITWQHLTGRSPSADTFLAFTLHARFSRALAELSQERYAALLAEANGLLAPYVGDDGLVFPIEMLVVGARS